MNFSKTASYSLNILSYMATHQDNQFSAALLHENLDIPYQYLRQVLAQLSREGFIQSTRGRSGGFMFKKPLEEISMADIIESTDGLESLNRCIMGFKVCPFDNACSLHPMWEQTRNSILKILKETSLADIAKKRN
jgi:Rrf2 family transcriptional regulator, iron-sulfur cluster assembly transcription factor